jgi:hypothetical protein
MLGLIVTAGIVDCVEDGVQEDDALAFAFFGVLMLLTGPPVIFGGIQMLRLKNRGFAMAAAILSLVPCCNCWIVGLPIGIWALVVLSDYHVRLAFQQGASAAVEESNPFRP